MTGAGSGQPVQIVLTTTDDQREIQRILPRHGMAIDCAANGAEGAQALLQASCGAIALDHDLGSEPGLDLRARIRAEPAPPPVIYVSGSDDAGVAASLKATLACDPQPMGARVEVQFAG